MVQIQNEVKRARGRPQVRSDEVTRQMIVEAAAQEFQANGYAATCIGDVAQRAGVSTRTLYRLIPTKAALFKSVISDRIGQFMLAIDNKALGRLDLTAALERILIEFGTLTLSEETIAMNRLVLGECDRFPEIATTFYEAAILQANRAIEGWLQLQCKRGLIKLDDPGTAAGLLRGMMIMEPQRAAMLGKQAAPDVDEIVCRARLCARIFLNGCRL
jgi:AcrR family transcriptional regulator